jgi:hypothetical protein
MNDATPYYVLGLDLGQAADPSALAVDEQTDAGHGLKNHAVRHLRRWPLGSSYYDIADEVAESTRRLPRGRVALVVDATGVGRPVVEIIRKARPAVGRLAAVTITAGSEVTSDAWGYKVPKRQLVGCVQSALQGGRLHVAAALPETKTLAHELSTFKAKVSLATGNETLEAWRERDFDDLVLALAMCCWYGDRGCRRVVFMC